MKIYVLQDFTEFVKGNRGGGLGGKRVKGSE